MSYTIFSFGCLIVILCVTCRLGSATDGLTANHHKDESVIVNTENATKESERTKKSLHMECSGISLNPKCLKIHALSFIEDLSSRDELSLLPGLSIVKENLTKSSQTPEEMAAQLSRQFPGKPEEKLNRFLLHRLQDYLENHSLKYTLLDPETTKEAMDVAKGKEVGRQGGGVLGALGGGGGGGGHHNRRTNNNSLMAAAMMMKGALAAAALGALALLAGKALMAALLSLLLSALVAFKGHGSQKSTTYEIITKPEISHHQTHDEHHEYEHGHYGGGYKRAYDPNYAYNSYEPYAQSS